MTDFVLDPRLAADTIPIAALPLSAALLMRDANYPWLILVPRRAGVSEIVDLDAADRVALIEEIARASAALRSVVQPEKLNVGALGNVVPQLHVHVVARRRGDPAWPGPVWGRARVPYPAGAAETLAAALAAHLR
jgi:diadenosine tetraphosphate (Ap4A) HIT family hydrolase